MTNTTLKPKDLPCLFKRFVEMCETKEKLKWRFASGEKSTERVKLLAKYFPELTSLPNSLENYSICEKHYNQLIANNYFIENLKKIGSSSSLPSMGENERKRPKITTNNNTIETSTHKIPKDKFEDKSNTDLIYRCRPNSFQHIKIIWDLGFGIWHYII